MTDFDALEKAGHEMTHVNGPIAGVSIYYCENCGAIAFTDPAVGFHVPRYSLTSESACDARRMQVGAKENRPTLREKIRARIKQAMEEFSDD